MPEKYLGEQGLAKLIKLVKENSGGSPIYVKSRKAPESGFAYSLTQNTLNTFVVTVISPIATNNIMVNICFDGTKSYTSFSQVFSFAQNGLWITEAYLVAQTDRVDMKATLFYIGPDENAINSGNFSIIGAKKIGDV